MPTAADFTAMVDRLALVDQYLSGIVGTVADAVGAAAIEGGPVADLVSNTVSRNELDVAAARGHVETAIETCVQRAEQCRRYSESYDSFDRAMDAYATRATNLAPGGYLGSPPWPPRAPGPWADRS